jgi:uncharacterized membrane protein YeaQ/YmgE (transglycosylase-associated protein family)
VWSAEKQAEGWSTCNPIPTTGGVRGGLDLNAGKPTIPESSAIIALRIVGAGCRFPSIEGHSKAERNHQRRRVMNFLAWIVVGLIAGWLAGQVMKGGGYGVAVDIILGILGGFLGGWIFGLLGIGAGSGMIGSIIVAFVGAVILVGITRLIKRA